MFYKILSHLHGQSEDKTEKTRKRITKKHFVDNYFQINYTDHHFRTINFHFCCHFRSHCFHQCCHYYFHYFFQCCFRYCCQYYFNYFYGYCCLIVVTIIWTISVAVFSISTNIVYTCIFFLVSSSVYVSTFTFSCRYCCHSCVYFYY